MIAAVRNVPSKRVQVDEIWSFTYAKQKNVARAKAAPEGAGDTWTWTALDADSKLIISWLLGGRDAGYAVPWCTTPIEADSSLGPDSHHPIISLSGIPSAVMVLRILHPILASTLCAANSLARIAEPTIAL